MKIYLLLIDHARFLFYSDESEAPEATDQSGAGSVSPQSGMRGWFLARYDRFRSAWLRADSGTLLWMRQAWDWLHTWAHPDEAMLARLWSARRINLYHPASRPSDLVLANWKDYLGQQWRRHLVWLIVNGVIAPISALFAILPGPNLIGYWFFYRAVHHALVVWGIRRVRRDKIPTELYPILALDLPVEMATDGTHSHATLAGRATGLDTHMKWHGTARAADVSHAAAEASVNCSQPADLQSEKSKDR